jgi:hypothetical protein
LILSSHDSHLISNEVLDLQKLKFDFSAEH